MEQQKRKKGGGGGTKERKVSLNKGGLEQG